MKRFLLLMLLSLALCQGVRSQGARYDNFVIKPLNTGGLTAVSGALITVCTSAGTGTPCTPKVANIYSDEALTTPITGTGGAGTTNSDSGGNFGFYLAPGSYIITVTGSGITSYTIKVVLPAVLGSGNIFTGTTTIATLNNIRTVDGVKFTTIAAALADLPTDTISDTGNSYKHGTIYLPYTSAGYTVASTLTLSPFVKIIGEGMIPAVINCPTATTCFIWNNNPFTVRVSDGGFSNVALKGDNSAGQIGVQVNDGTGFTANFVRVFNFSGAGAVGINVSNISFWSERINFNRIWFDNNTIGLQLNGGSNNSFAHQYFHDIQFNLNNTQTAISLTGNAFLHAGFMDGVANANGATTTVWNLTGTSQIDKSFMMVFEADVGSGTCTGVSASASTLFAPSGTFRGYQATSGTGKIISFVPSTSINPLLVNNLALGVLNNAGTSISSGTFVIGNTGAAGNFYQGIGWNGYFDGTNWVTIGDGANNGASFALVVAGANAGIRFYSIPSTGGTGQTISSATLDSTYFRAVLDNANLNLLPPLNLSETTAPAAASGRDIIYGDSTAHCAEGSYNNGAFSCIPLQGRANTFSAIQAFPSNTAALTADWTCGTAGTVSSCVAATIIGSGGGVPLTFTLPSVAQSYTLECDGVVGQATAVTANQWNLLTATNGATNVTANYTMATAATAFAAGAITDQASTTTTFQIAPSWTLGAIGTKMPFHIYAKIEGASASGTVVSLQLVAPTVGDLVTIYRGASCRIF